MAANAVKFATLYYQIQQETIYYTVETDPIKISTCTEYSQFVQEII